MSYRGNVSETDNGNECLYWNSHFVLVKGTNPFTAYQDKDGLGSHNFCRSGENKMNVFKLHTASTHNRNFTHTFSVMQKPGWRQKALVLLQKRPQTAVGLL